MSNTVRSDTKIHGCHFTQEIHHGISGISDLDEDRTSGMTETGFTLLGMCTQSTRRI
jgi:hypothetical protein